MPSGNYADFSEAYKALKKLSKNVDRDVNQIMDKEVAPFVVKEMEKRTPKWDASKYQGKRGSYMLKHAKDHVVASKVKDGRIEVGYDDDVAWRMHFIEFGTIKQRPQHFVKKTLNAIEDEVQDIIAREIKRRLLR